MLGGVRGSSLCHHRGGPSAREGDTQKSEVRARVPSRLPVNQGPQGQLGSGADSGVRHRAHKGEEHTQVLFLFLFIFAKKKERERFLLQINSGELISLIPRGCPGRAPWSVSPANSILGGAYVRAAEELREPPPTWG